MAATLRTTLAPGGTMDESGTLPLMRQSERAAFKRCNWAWYQGYVRNLAPRVEKWATAAEFGTGIHWALAEYYQPGKVRGPHPADTFDVWAKEYIAKIKTQEIVDGELVDKWIDFRTLGIDLMEAYVEHYGGDPHWDILDAERRFSVTIPDVRYKPLQSAKGKRGYRPICNLVGTFDLVYRDLNDGLVKMTDHKTCASISTSHLTLDEQASTYIAVATHALRNQGLIGEKEVVKGMEYNMIRKGKVDDRPRNANGEYLNKDGTVSKRQGSPLFMRYFVPRTPAERQRQIVRISEEARMMDDVREGRLPLLKTPTRDCNFCKMFDLCELDESGLDTEYFIETTMKVVDPYHDHREGAENSKRVSNGSQIEG